MGRQKGWPNAGICARLRNGHKPAVDPMTLRARSDRPWPGDDTFEVRPVLSRLADSRRKALTVENEPEGNKPLPKLAQRGRARVRSSRQKASKRQRANFACG